MPNGKFVLQKLDLNHDEIKHTVMGGGVLNSVSSINQLCGPY